MKAIIKYPGSKWSLADWIISFFPEHHSYLEPFFELLKDWHREERTAYSQVHSKTKEILWMNFEPIRQIRLEEVM